MSEDANSATTDASDGPPSAVILTAGTILRQAREAAGLHIAALAVSMKVPVKKLEALEADRLDLLLDAVFARALAASVCRTLKIDPTPVLERLPQTMAPRLNSSENGINAPFHVPGQSVGITVPAFLAKPGVLAVFALLVGAVVVALFPDFQSPRALEDAGSVATPVSVTSFLPEPVTQQGVAGAVVAPLVVASEPVSILQSNVLAPPMATKPHSVASQPLVASEGSGTSTGAVSIPPGLVVFKAKGASWVEVTDANGNVQVRRTLSAGEAVGASGALPLSVVVGRLDLMDVEVRGKTFDLASVGRDNVARFEVR